MVLKFVPNFGALSTTTTKPFSSKQVWGLINVQLKLSHCVQLKTSLAIYAHVFIGACNALIH
jgi:hypothetical protein